MNLQEARTRYQSDAAKFHELGAIAMDSVISFTPPEFKRNYAAFKMAMDAQPALFTTANNGVPAYLTTLIDPDIYEILFSPNKAAIIFGENKKGSWLDDAAVFPVVEHVGEVSSYGDYANNGHASANTNWPNRQSYLFQTVKQYGERELERAGLARINWVSEIDKAAATVLNKYQNLTYFFGVQGLQNYGLLNDPNLSAALSPSLKAHTGGLGLKWVVNGVVVATAEEIYRDIQSIFIGLVQQSGGLIDKETPVTLAMSPESEMALTATNSFNVNVSDLLKKNFPNLKVVTAVQYGVLSASNPQGVVAGNMVQMIAGNIEGQDTGYMAFNEKMRAHQIIPDMSSWKQKVTGGTWGAIIRMPAAIKSMVGV